MNLDLCSFGYTGWGAARCWRWAGVLGTVPVLALPVGTRAVTSGPSSSSSTAEPASQLALGATCAHSGKHACAPVPDPARRSSVLSQGYYNDVIFAFFPAGPFIPFSVYWCGFSPNSHCKLCFQTNILKVFVLQKAGKCCRTCAVIRWCFIAKQAQGKKRPSVRVSSVGQSGSAAWGCSEGVPGVVTFLSWFCFFRKGLEFRSL